MLTRLRQRLLGETVAIPDALWNAQCDAFPLMRALPPQDLALLRQLCIRFLARKTITGAAGFVVEPYMQLHIAAQACLPVLKLGLEWYRGWRGIVVYPAAFRVHRRIHDEGGLVHEYDDELSGEAWDGGPVVLSWEDSGPASAPDTAHRLTNVVIHEFAHTLDLLSGAADGVPPLDARLHPGLPRAYWREVLEDAYERFCAGLEMIESEIPPDVDPDSPEADRYFERLPLDPYAASDPGEFFAVSSEAYFLDAPALSAAFPQWFDLLHRFYRSPLAVAADPH